MNDGLSQSKKTVWSKANCLNFILTLPLGKGLKKIP